MELARATLNTTGHTILEKKLYTLYGWSYPCDHSCIKSDQL